MQIIPLSVLAIIIVYLTIRSLMVDEDKVYRSMWEFDATKLPDWAKKDPQVVARCFKDLQYRMEVLSATHPQVIHRLKKEANANQTVRSIA